jgi:hypothetical protein
MLSINVNWKNVFQGVGVPRKCPSQVKYAILTLNLKIECSAINLTTRAEWGRYDATPDAESSNYSIVSPDPGCGTFLSS